MIFLATPRTGMITRLDAATAMPTGDVPAG